MATVGELIDRIKRSWLEHPDDYPTRCTLDGALTDSATSLTYDNSLLTAEEEELFAPGMVIEINSELIVVGTVDEDNSTLSGLVRGAQGTTAAAHSDDDIITISPSWARVSIFDAIADSVMSLWPELYEVATSTEFTISETGPTDVDADVELPLWFWRQTTSTSGDWRKLPVTFYDQAPFAANGKAISVPGGGTGYLVYRRRFTRPTAESDDLQTDAGIDLEWERLVEVAAVSHLVAGRDVESLTLETLSEQLEIQGRPVGSSSRVRDALLRYERFLRDKARAQLRGRYRTPITRGTQVVG